MSRASLEFHHASKNDPAFLIILPQPSRVLGLQADPITQRYAVVETEHKALCMLSQDSTTRATSPSPPGPFSSSRFRLTAAMNSPFSRVVMQLKNEMTSFISRVLFSSEPTSRHKETGDGRISDGAGFWRGNMPTLSTSARPRGFFLALAWDRNEGKDTGFQTPDPHPMVLEGRERETCDSQRAAPGQAWGQVAGTMLRQAIFSVNERNLNWLLPQCNQLFLHLKDWDPVQPWGRGMQSRS